MTTNSTTEIVSTGFMDGRKGHNFYEMTEAEMFLMSYTHYKGRNTPLTEVSSWSSSLHLVLCYASSMPPNKNAHIAVSDWKSLELEAMIWHAPQLIGIGLYEHLAHGIVRGNEYTATSFTGLVDHGLYDVFPELQKWMRPYKYEFGCSLRQKMFDDLPTDVTETETAAIRRVRHLFGALSLPVMIALVCIQHRKPIARTKPALKRTADRLITLLGIEKVDLQLASEPWFRPGAVRTTEPGVIPFQDVEQWIELLHVISQFPPPPKAKRKRDESEQEEDPEHVKLAQHPAKIQRRYYLRETSGRAMNARRQGSGSLDGELIPHKKGVVHDLHDSGTDDGTEDEDLEVGRNDTDMTDPEP